MKTVYVAERGFDSEGFSILGVYETREEAEAAIEAHTVATGDVGADYYEIEEFVLGEGSGMAALMGPPEGVL